MTRLEERYRRVLRLLPASYREVWEEDMVSSFLASVECDDREDADYMADFGRPGWSEVASIVALAVRLRIGSAGAPPRYLAWGEAIRLSVLAGMLVKAAAGMVGLVMTLWLAGMIPLAPAPPVLPEPPGYPDSWHRVFLFAALVGLLWLPTFLALVSGRWMAARWLASAAGVAAVLAAALTVFVTNQRMSGEVSYSLLINVLLVLALAAVHRGVALLQRRFWLTALGLGTVVVAGYALVTFRSTTSLPPLDWAGLWCLVLVAAAVVHVAGRALRRLDRFSAWTPALAILAFTVLGLRLVALWDYARFGSAAWHPATVAFGIAEAIAVGAAALVLTLLSARTLRRLPATAADTTAWSTPIR